MVVGLGWKRDSRSHCTLMSGVEKGFGNGESGFAFRYVRFGMPVRPSGGVDTATRNASPEFIV